MKRLFCWIGRHSWTTRIAKGEKFSVCSVCGKEKGGGGAGGGEAQREHAWDRVDTSGLQAAAEVP